MSDYAHDTDLFADLEKAKLTLHTFYHNNYSIFTFSTDKHNYLTMAPIVQNGLPQKIDFTAKYK
jgi:hypothetical protein